MTTIVSEPQTFDIDGQRYTIRRLAVRDAFALGKIVAKAMAETGTHISGQMSEDVIGILIFTSLPYAEKEAYELCGSLLSVTGDEFANLPPEALPLLLDALAEHNDIERFFSVCSRVWRDGSNLKKLWNMFST